MKLLILFFILVGCSHGEFVADSPVANSAASKSAVSSRVKTDSVPAPLPDGSTAIAAPLSDGSTVAGAPTPAPTAAPFANTCLNIQDGDWHIEFDGRRLLLAESGRPKALALEHGQPVACSKLELVKNARNGTVLIEFTTGARGTSVGVSEKMLGLANVKTAKWTLEPITLEQHFDQGDQTEVREFSTANWSTDADGKPVLTVIDSKSGQSSVYRP